MGAGWPGRPGRAASPCSTSATRRCDGEVASIWGYLPEWSPNGNELFFREIRGSNDLFDRRPRLWVVEYSVNGDVFVPGAVRPFPESVLIPPRGASSMYTVAKDGRVLAPIAVDRAGADGRPSAGFDNLLARRSHGVIMNVQELIRRRELAAGR